MRPAVRARRLVAFGLLGLCLLALASPPRGDRGSPAARKGLAAAQMSSPGSASPGEARDAAESRRKGALTAARAAVDAAVASFGGLALLGATDPRAKGECGGCAWVS